MENKIKESKYLLPLSIVIAGAMLALAWMYNTRLRVVGVSQNISVVSEEISKTELEEKVLPTEGAVLPATWGDLGKKLVSVGAIDGEKFKTLYKQREQFTEEYEKLLFSNNNGKMKKTPVTCSIYFGRWDLQAITPYFQTKQK